jgi:hypothetical protein
MRARHKNWVNGGEREGEEGEGSSLLSGGGSRGRSSQLRSRSSGLKRGESLKFSWSDGDLLLSETNRSWIKECVENVSAKFREKNDETAYVELV